MRGWRRHGDELEAQLRAQRVDPSSELAAGIIGRLSHEQRRSPIGAALAVAVTAAGLAVFGAFGGVGYASSAAHSFAQTIAATHTATPKGPQNSSRGASNSSANDQYVGKTTICHRTHSAKNPFVVISVSNNALAAHKGHGDTLVGPGGTCPGPPIP
jgi:hypothetical protein